MKHLLIAAALVAALCSGGAAQAGVLTFDDPAIVDIDNNIGIATYTERGFTISGPAASFLTLNDSLVGGIDASTPFSLKALGGGPFSLLSLDHAFFDLGFGAPPGALIVTGLLNGVQVASQQLSLGDLASFGFGAGWARVSEVTFSGTTGFALDNLSVLAIPEPGTLALTAAGLAAVLFSRRRRRGTP